MFWTLEGGRLTVSDEALGIAIAGPTRAVLFLSYHSHLSAQLDFSGLHPLQLGSLGVEAVIPPAVCLFP